MTDKDAEEHHKMIKEMQDEKKSARVFCIGNGESRIGIDLYKYKKFGRIYGCNAIYRDHPNLCDVLTGVDHGYDGGTAVFNNQMERVPDIYKSAVPNRLVLYHGGRSHSPCLDYTFKERLTLSFFFKIENNKSYCGLYEK